MKGLKFEDQNVIMYYPAKAIEISKFYYMLQTYKLLSSDGCLSSWFRWLSDEWLHR